MRILLVEDDFELGKITTLNLKREGFTVDLVYLGRDAIRALEEDGEYDVIVLDLVLPDVEGTKVLEKIKSTYPKTPVLALTGKDQEDDRINGINIGFDDYLTKPFSCLELVARLRVLYRSISPFPEEILKIGPLSLHPKTQTAFKNESLISLTLSEFRLLEYLFKNKERFVSSEELSTTVWDRNGINGKAKVITAISRLRKKISDHYKKIIKTVNGGYLLGGTDD